MQIINNVGQVYSENRSTGWVDQVVTSPVILWNAENVSIWEAEIPASYITLSKGNATLQISGTGMKMVTIPLTIGTIGGGGGMGILTKAYTVDYTNRTITFTDTSLDKRDIVRIRGIDRNLDVYDQDRISAGKNDISLDGDTPGLFHYDYDIPTDETLKIWLES